MKKKLLIIGGNSKIGTKLRLLIKKDYEIFFTSRKASSKSIFSELDDIKKIDISINNINLKKIKFDAVIFLQGELVGKSLRNFRDEELIKNFNINFLSVLFLLKKLNFAKKSCVIFVSSISGRKGSFDPIYASAKAALINLTKSLATWQAPKQHFLCLCPGHISNTKMSNMLSKKRKQFHLKQNPNKKFLSPKEFANIIQDLLKPHWKQANGAIIDINGGVY